ncbi:GumC family protein [Thioclava pacifica]|uniref:Polysaccharide chain length determinant N-terminal domain-containing protein n=1 Tax=Thioclava pacifica DSM 10166 TaxID=1353537 RepID=A0A074J536_9RHOB|nr:Wzz/FepE/Etk N-terminal domain-containing protein [Thioclava pacifica]KEO51604.1 hypothetical protein TP2_11960 [Thioclava pacifica DSM 10166]
MRDLRFYASLLLRRLHWLILLTLIGTMAGLVVARLITPIYEANALLVVEGERIPDQLASSTVQTDTNAKLQVIRKRVLARDNLLDMARRMDLYPGLLTASGARDVDAVFSALSNDLSIEITKDAGSGGDRKNATFMTVSYIAGSPTRAAQVANELVTRILKEDADIRTKAARDTLDFFSREVDRLNAELAKSSAAILQFKQENSAALPERLPVLRDQFAALQLSAPQLADQIKEIEDQKDRLIRRREVSGKEVDLDAIYPPAQRDLARLEAQRDALRQVLPSDDPRIAALGAQIVELGAGASVPLAKPASAFEERLRALENDLFAARARQEAAEVQMAQLQTEIAKVPANAAALEALQRDHENLLDQYGRATKSRAVAETGDTIESLAKGEKLTVIDQAVAPNEPVKPNRKTITIAGFGAGFVLGLLLIVGRELLNPGIRRPEDLQRQLGITAFATLPYIATPADLALRRRQFMISSGMVLGALIVVLVLFGLLYMPLDRIF